MAFALLLVKMRLFGRNLLACYDQVDGVAMGSPFGHFFAYGLSFWPFPC